MEWWRHLGQEHSAYNLSPIFELPHDHSQESFLSRRQVNQTYGREW